MSDLLLIKASLPIGGRGTASYVNAWKALLETTAGVNEREVQKALFAHLYENLNILDGKTNSLIQLNGIVIAAYVFLVSVTSLRLPKAASAVFVFGVAYATIAVFLCLRVIWVHWSSRADLRNSEAHMRALIRVRTQRTIEFRRAWTFCLISICALVFMLVNDFIEHWDIEANYLIPIIICVHLYVVYAHDDLVLLFTHRNVGLRVARIRTAIAGGRIRWRIIARALKTKSNWPQAPHLEVGGIGNVRAPRA